MRVRHPPGRAGRPWLAHRLEVARRGAALLDEKLLALAREQRRLAPRVGRARDEWERAAREARLSLQRAVVLDGRRALELFRSAATPAAEARLRQGSVLGTAVPTEAQLTHVPRAERDALGGSAALIAAAQAHRRALEAALRVASLEGAMRRIEEELRLTAVRRNAVERRWIPAHAEALRALEMTLEELEREDSARVGRLRGGTLP